MVELYNQWGTELSLEEWLESAKGMVDHTDWCTTRDYLESSLEVIGRLRFLLAQCLEDNHQRDKSIWDEARAAVGKSEGQK